MLSHVHTSVLLGLTAEVNKHKQVGLPLPGVIPENYDWEYRDQCWDSKDDQKYSLYLISHWVCPWIIP